MDEMEYFWDTTKSYVTDGNGHERSQEEPPLSAAYESARDEGWLYEDDDGNLRLTGDDEDVGLEWDKLREPLLPDLYDFEVEQPRAKRMKPYRSGSLTQRSYYWKSNEVVKEQLTKRWGREPDIGELEYAINTANSGVNRSERGRKNEVAIAQAIYNKGLTPFIGDEFWKKPLEKPEPKKGETKKEWEERVKEWKEQKEKETQKQKEQTDLYAAGIPIECKSFYRLDAYSKAVDGELYIFVCSASSFYAKPDGLRYYLLSYGDVSSNIYLSQTYKLNYVCPTSPVVVPTGRIGLREMEWEDHQRGTELGMFVKAADLISFNQFIRELKRHREEIRKTSRKLEDIGVVRLFYPHLDQQELQEKLEQEHARLLRHQQKLDLEFDF